MDNNFRREGSTDALPIGYLLHWYELLEVIGRGGYGITYLALDRNLQRKVAIKEYLPLDFACRDATDTVHPVTNNHKELFDWGLERFQVEARTLAKFNHPAIIRVVSVFEHNKTAYMVMEYEEGDDLAIAYMERAPFSEQELLDIFVPIVEGLSLVHDAGFIHRDIKPSNIYVRSDGSPVLLDFGSARQTIGSQTRALTSLVTAGYAPFEQYNESEDAQGAWTDIYGLGAALYFCMTGSKPADAMERGSALLKMKDDIYQPLSQMDSLPYSYGIRLAVDHALRFHAEDRPQDALQWADMLTGIIEPAPLPAGMAVESELEPEEVDAGGYSEADDTVVAPASNDISNDISHVPDGDKAATVTGKPAEQSIQETLQHYEEDEEDDSTIVYHRPPHKPAAEHTVLGTAAAPSRDNSDERQEVDTRADSHAHVVQPTTVHQAESSAPSSAEGDTATEHPGGSVFERGTTPSSTASSSQQPTESSPEPPTPQSPDQQPSPVAKDNVVGQWRDKLQTVSATIITGTVSKTKALRERVSEFLDDRTPKEKIAAASVGGVALLLVGGLLVMAGNDSTDSAETMTVKLSTPEPASTTGQSTIDEPATATQSHESTIEQATQDLIQGLLAQAKLDVANNRILEPEKNNAVYRYKKVLSLQSDQPEALQGLAVLTRRYENLINATIDEQSWEQAKQQIAELKQITDDPRVIKPLQARLKDYEKQLQTMAKNLARAEQYMKSNRLTRPESGNALLLYTKVLEVDPDNKRASEGVNKIVVKLSDYLRQQIKSRRFSTAEKTFSKIESIDPSAPVLAEAEGKLAAVVERRKSVGKLLKSAERDFIRGNLTRPPGNNAYAKYRKVLRISPGNKEAKKGVDRIYGYYVSSYYQYLDEARFKKAESMVNTLRRIDYGKKQIVILRRMIQEEKLAARNEPETIKLMLSQLEKGLKNKDLSAVDSLSSYKNKNRQFLKQLFDKYSTYSVKVMQTDHDLKSHQAKARVNFSGLVVDDSDNNENQQKDIKLDIKVSRNEDKKWTITW
jgi:serine/threonine protein kinase/tetratricopeptide (TPR) repeat protein